MIHRIGKIKGVGRFDDPPAIGSCQFGKNTIIFGSNAVGKSTLTDIFRSLKTGSGDLVKGRRRFGFSADQEIKLVDANGTEYIFPSSDWDAGREDLEIFDTQFIDENIFEGHAISYDQQKNLNGVIIGKKGRDLATEINQLQETVQKFAADKTEVTRHYNVQFRGKLEYELFERLEEIPNAQQKVKELQDRIAIVNNQVAVGQIFSDVESRLARILNQGTKDHLSKTLDVRASLVVDHIEKTWKDPQHPLDFLQTGRALTKDDEHDCVFCGQELGGEAKQLIQVYAKMFADEYSSLQKEVVEAVDKFRKWTPADNIQGFADTLRGAFGAVLSLDKIDFDEVNAIKARLDIDFDRKARDIGHQVQFDDFDKLLDVFRELEANVAELKTKFISGEAGELHRLERELALTEMAIERHTEGWKELVKKRKGADAASTEATLKREGLRKQLEQHSEAVYVTHFETINQILQKLGADFKLVNTQPIHRLVGKTERIFEVQFFGSHDVNLLTSDLDQPRFGNTLSDSDKRVLAFAFFYSVLLHDPKIDEKIVVLDDPFSSFDTDRREATIQLLSNPYLSGAHGEPIAKQFKQLIILTHEKEYYKWLATKLSGVKSFELEPDGDNNGVKKSKLVACDVQRKFIDPEAIRSLKSVKEIVDANIPIPDYEGYFVKARKILEGIMKRKYFFNLKDEINANASVRSFGQKLQADGLGFYNNAVKYAEYDNLCRNLNIDLHDGEIHNDGSNARTVLADFLRLLPEV